MTLAMENELQAILDSLPPPRRRSKLEPYAALIRALRARGRSYREIVAILRERCGLTVATHTLYHFVRARGPKDTTPRRPSSLTVRSSSDPGRPTSPSSSDGQEEAWARIAAVKQRAPTSATKPKAFAYDENEPLQLIAEVKPRRR